GESTRALVAQDFDFAPKELRSIKGKGEKVPVFFFGGVRKRLAENKGARSRQWWAVGGRFQRRKIYWPRPKISMGRCSTSRAIRESERAGCHRRSRSGLPRKDTGFLRLQPSRSQPLSHIACVGRKWMGHAGEFAGLSRAS